MVLQRSIKITINVISFYSNFSTIRNHANGAGHTFWHSSQASSKPYESKSLFLLRNVIIKKMAKDFSLYYNAIYTIPLLIDCFCCCFSFQDLHIAV